MAGPIGPPVGVCSGGVAMLGKKLPIHCEKRADPDDRQTRRHLDLLEQRQQQLRRHQRDDDDGDEHDQRDQARRPAPASRSRGSRRGLGARRVGRGPARTGRTPRTSRRVAARPRGRSRPSPPGCRGRPGCQPGTRTRPSRGRSSPRPGSSRARRAAVRPRTGRSSGARMKARRRARCQPRPATPRRCATTAHQMPSNQFRRRQQYGTRWPTDQRERGRQQDAPRGRPRAGWRSPPRPSRAAG